MSNTEDHPKNKADAPKKDAGLLRLVGLASAALGGVIALSALVGVVFVTRAALGDEVPAQTFYVLMFEPVVLLSGLFAVALGLGRIKDGRAMSLAMCGGAVAILAVLSDTSIPSRMYGANAPSAIIGGVAIQKYAIMRLFAGLALGSLAGVFALVRSGKAGRAHILRAIVLSVPVVIGLGAGVFLLTSRGRSALSGFSPSLAAIGLVIGLFVVGGCLAAAVHQWIRAFEAGAPAEHLAGDKPGKKAA